MATLLVFASDAAECSAYRGLTLEEARQRLLEVAECSFELAKRSALITVRQNQAQMKQLLELRRRVFLEEIGRDRAVEKDAIDDAATHVIALGSGESSLEVVGTLRLYDPGQIGRVAVAPEWRGRGVGWEMMLLAHECARRRGREVVFVHAEESAIGFYNKLGYQPEGQLFNEAGKPHLLMKYPLYGG